jgi:Phage derived protein Gp49-like (DUF891)
MRELRIQHEGRPYRVLNAFDPRQSSVLLIGGDKTGKGRGYEEYVPIADRIYGEHVAQLKREGLMLFLRDYLEHAAHTREAVHSGRYHRHDITAWIVHRIERDI